MINKTRKDFSYDLWGEPVSNSDENRLIFNMNSKYGTGKSVSLKYDTGIYPTLSSSNLDFKLNDSMNIHYFKTNAIYVAKILNGKVMIKGEDGLNILFKEGDIVCFLGNYIINQKYAFEGSVKMKAIGIFAYVEEILEVFKKNNWDTNIIYNILYNTDLKLGVKLSKTNSLVEILNELYEATKDDNRFVAYIKSMELFYYFIKAMNNKKHSKAKTYTEAQVESVVNIKNFLDNHLDAYYSMPELAEMFNISLSRMQSIFTDYYELSPYRYHLMKRLEKANDLIINTDIKIVEIAKSVGFTSYDNFFKAYKNKYGFNPSKHRMT